MTKQWTFKDYLGDKDFYKRMAMIAIPISLQQLITVGINLMDTIMLSSMGDAQLSASSLAGQFINLFQICCMGIGMGASVLTSRFWGMKNSHALKQSITIMLRVCLVFSVIFTLATLLAPTLIMKMYSNDPLILEYGALYFRWLLPTYFCMGLSLTCTIVLRSVGEVKIPLTCSIIAFFINIFFNWIFIFGKLGMPRMEIAGAALGTLISRIFELVFICGFFFFKDQKIQYRLSNLNMKCQELVSEYFRISIGRMCLM